MWVPQDCRRAPFLCGCALFSVAGSEMATGLVRVSLYIASRNGSRLCRVRCSFACNRPSRQAGWVMVCIGMVIAYAGASTFSGVAYSASSPRSGHVAWCSRSLAPVMGLNSDAAIENSLQNRIGEISSMHCPERVTLLIQDAMVPRQRMYIRNAPAAYVALLEAAQMQNTPVCMVGRYRTIHSHGVQVAVQAISSHADGTADVVLRGDRYMKVVEAEVCETLEDGDEVIAVLDVSDSIRSETETLPGEVNVGVLQRSSAGVVVSPGCQDQLQSVSSINQTLHHTSCQLNITDTAAG